MKKILSNQIIVKKFITFLIFFVFIAILSGCGRAKPKQPIKIGLNIWPGNSYIFVAKEKGFFDKNAVGVELILKETITESDELYLNGDVDGVITVFANAIMLYSHGKLSKVVYVIDQSTEGDVIIANPQVSSLADLRGKVVSFEGVNTFSHMFVIKMLEETGIPVSDLEFKLVAAKDVLAALEKGQIDAGHTWEPVKSRALNKGYKIIATAADIPNLIADVLVFDEDIVNQRPADIQHIVKSLVEARNFYSSNREQAIEIMARSENMREEELIRGLAGVHLFSFEDNIKALAKEEDDLSLYKSGQKIADFYLNRGQLLRVPDFNELIEPAFVLRVKKELEKKQ